MTNTKFIAEELKSKQNTLPQGTDYHREGKYYTQYSERIKSIVKEHKKKMYDMRFFSLEWQAIHQQRWDGDDCNNNTCDCEELNYEGTPPDVK